MTKAIQCFAYITFLARKKIAAISNSVSIRLIWKAYDTVIQKTNPGAVIKYVSRNVYQIL